MVVDESVHRTLLSNLAFVEHYGHRVREGDLDNIRYRRQRWCTRKMTSTYSSNGIHEVQLILTNHLCGLTHVSNRFKRHPPTFEMMRAE
jgi:hypothetical protein